jgi:hypothetical protein
LDNKLIVGGYCKLCDGGDIMEWERINMNKNKKSHFAGFGKKRENSQLSAIKFPNLIKPPQKG